MTSTWLNLGMNWSEPRFENDITRAKNDIKLGSRKVEIRGAHSERTFSKKTTSKRDISRKKILEYGQVLQSVQFYDGLERGKSRWTP